MYEGARTKVRSSAGCTNRFDIKVGIHQVSCLSPLLFIILMDVVSEAARREVPWGLLYVYDLSVVEARQGSVDDKRP